MTSNGAPPTRVEIADHFGFKTPNAAEDHLKALDKKGHIELKSGTSRGILITDLARAGLLNGGNSELDIPGAIPLHADNQNISDVAVSVMLRRAHPYLLRNTFSNISAWTKACSLTKPTFF